MFIRLLGVAVIAVCFAGSAQAHELESVMHHHYLLGEWSCVGHVHTPDGERVDTVGSWKIRRSFHGHIFDKFENYAGNGFAYKAKGMTSYDKLAGVLNRHVLSSMGTWTRYVSKGWDDDTLAWQGESHRFGHHPTPIEQIITKKDDHTFELRVRVQNHDNRGYDGKDNDGKNDGWKNMYKGTCSRQSAPEDHAGDHKDDSKGDTIDQGKQGDTGANAHGDDVDHDNDEDEDENQGFNAAW